MHRTSDCWCGSDSETAIQVKMKLDRPACFEPGLDNAKLTTKKKIITGYHIEHGRSILRHLDRFVVPGFGKNGVSVAAEMFRAIGSPHWRNQVSRAGWFSTITRGLPYTKLGGIMFYKYEDIKRILEVLKPAPIAQFTYFIAKRS